VNYFENSKSGQDVSGIKAKGTLHWVSCADSVDAEVRLYDRLFSESAPEAGGNFMDCLNSESLVIKTACKLEPSLADAAIGAVYQFTRLGYFTMDSKYSSTDHLVFNRTVTLKDGWKGGR
jgi:glutaminyl-tRNA synthetase